ncbi:cob(I)yrinic acid a,c-diamide adenosyltransferase [Heliorestis acidaminivorans]|uniref:Cob(I)yrinic acid a,c-diamide adenosyltransferase n=1 Tax=Heliorestis acidaminivorans TaxID=553427 RepID=A0A6I0EU35_9FIRM|nr:cob(I)yrinic acid a,c-diamide adenosyltransferase [Heliorestis acidaminivorans]KAB2954295.1 cob(I)yrinic acid a,c-diamide adenosyltransferase [Heliorestis acidaminivorans]
MSERKTIEGLVQVYTGTGKGKTTAALGLAYRAIGHGFRVCFIQFLKGSSYTGELLTSQRLKPDIDFYQFGRGCPFSSMIRSGMRKCNGCGECFFKDNKKKEENKEFAHMALSFADDVISQAKYDLVVLDEISNALRYDFISVEQVIALIEKKPAPVELVLTGRGIPEEILDHADLVSEIHARKHPLQKGIKSRRGIEY